MEKAILFAVVFGIVSALFTLIVETGLGVHIPLVCLSVNALLIGIGLELVIWTNARNKQ